jgi:hypothetical protein
MPKPEKVRVKGKKVPHKVFSLDAQARLYRVWRQQGALRETCKECGFKVRGPNHESGTHHAKRHPSMRLTAEQKVRGL